jgi:SAM-dependent methyltransferase
VIGRRELPADYERWNEEWGAPFGHGLGPALSVDERLGRPDPAALGPFAFQPNNLTRLYEYPWAYFSAQLRPGMRVLDVGGGLSGLQFVVAKLGCEVVNVDPSAREGAANWFPIPGLVWPVNHENHKRVNEILDTDVRLVADRVQDADLASNWFDRVFCMSVLEHVEQDEARDMLRTLARVLNPGGLGLVTVDLFLDLAPFAPAETNVWGRNIDVCRLLDGLDLELTFGDRSELLGFPEFDAQRVLAIREELLAGFNHAVAEVFILRKPG